MRIAGQLILHRIHPAVSEAYQSMIGKRILTSNLRVHLNPDFRELGLHTHKKK